MRLKILSSKIKIVDNYLFFKKMTNIFNLAHGLTNNSFFKTKNKIIISLLLLVFLLIEKNKTKKF